MLQTGQDTPAGCVSALGGSISPSSLLSFFKRRLFILLDSPSHLMAAGLQSCSWHPHLYYCWPGTQLPVWPLPLPATPESGGSCWGLLQLWCRKNGGIVCSNLSIASYFDITSHPCNREGEASLPLQRISTLCREVAGCQSRPHGKRAEGCSSNQGGPS